MEPPPKRFCSSTVEEREKLVKDAVPKKTREADKFWASVIAEFIREKKYNIDLETSSVEDIAKFLESFFVDLRKKDGSTYKQNSLSACRAAIQRMLTNRNVNLMKDSQFANYNRIYKSLIKQRRRDGDEQQVQHHEPINSSDWDLIQTFFEDISTTTDAVKLSQYVWFQVTVHFCLRGGEIQTQMRKQDLDFVPTGDGSQIIKLSRDFMSKNHQTSAFSTSGCITDSVQVSAIRKYLNKLNDGVDRLFQRAVMNVNDSMTCWYMKSPLSHNLLGTMLRKISEAAQCSRSYTNHCLRATSINHMKQQGVEDRKIATVSGHKSIDSLKAYDRTTEEEAVKMSAAIDKKPVSVLSSSSAVCNDSSVSPNHSVVSGSGKENSSPLPEVMLNANGAVFNNVTFHTVVQKPKKRLSLKLKKREKSI